MDVGAFGGGQKLGLGLRRRGEINIQGSVAVEGG